MLNLLFKQKTNKLESLFMALIMICYKHCLSNKEVIPDRHNQSPTAVINFRLFLLAFTYVYAFNIYNFYLEGVPFNVENVSNQKRLSCQSSLVISDLKTDRLSTSQVTQNRFGAQILCLCSDFFSIPYILLRL